MKLNFLAVLPFVLHALAIISQVESMPNMTGQQKLDMARQLLMAAYQDLRIAPQSDPAKVEAAINGLVSVLNLFVK